jgi:hypothetical protein
MSSNSCDQERDSDQCGCGKLETQEQDAANCSGSITVPTLEEQHVLSQIRQLQNEAQRVKQAIRRMESLPNPPETSLADLREQLLALRRRRADLEDQRIRAAHERMRLLGHA